MKGKYNDWRDMCKQICKANMNTNPRLEVYISGTRKSDIVSLKDDFGYGINNSNGLLYRLTNNTFRSWNADTSIQDRNYITYDDFIKLLEVPTTKKYYKALKGLQCHYQN